MRHTVILALLLLSTSIYAQEGSTRELSPKGQAQFAHFITSKNWILEAGRRFDKKRLQTPFQYPYFTVYDAFSEDIIFEMDEAIGHKIFDKYEVQGFSSMAYAQELQVIALGSPGQIFFFKINHKKILKVLKTNSDVLDIQFSANGNRLFSAHNDNTIRIWDTREGKLLHILRGHNGAVNCLKIYPNDLYLLSGSEDKTIRLWDLQNNQLLQIYRGHSSPIQSIDINPNGESFISSDNNEAIYFWEFEEKELIRTLKSEVVGANIIRATFGPSGKKLLRFHLMMIRQNHIYRYLMSIQARILELKRFKKPVPISIFPLMDQLRFCLECPLVTSIVRRYPILILWRTLTENPI